MMDYTESVLVEYDPSLVRYQGILTKWKSLIRDPVPSLDRQYRVAVFYCNQQQKENAHDFCNGMSDVDVAPVTKFYKAEERHQHFLARL